MTGISTPTYRGGFYSPSRGGIPKYPELWRGCVGAWSPVLGPSGLSVFDQTAGRNTAAFTNGQAGNDWGTGSFNAILINTTNRITPAAPLAISEALTYSISCWFRPTAWTGSNPGIARSGITAAGTDFCIFQGTTGRPWIRRNNADVLRPGSGASVSLGTWQHIVFTSSPTFAAFSLNGALVHLTSHATTNVATSSFFSFPGQNSFNERPQGSYADFRFYFRGLTNSEIDLLYSIGPGGPYELAPRQRNYFALAGAAPAGPTYTLTADAGSFALTGIDAGLQASRLLTADVGSFALTGQDAGLLANRSLTADAGSFTLTGIDAGLIAGRRITADLGTFALTGIDAGMLARRLLTADAGSFALTGIDANLLANRLLSADVGEFALTGINVDLTYSGAGGPTYTLTCDAGSFTLTGIDAGLLANRRITADAGSFALTGIDAAVLVNRLITADTGAFALTGIDAAFVVNRRLAADTGAFVLTGIDANLTYSGATSSSASIYYYLMMGS